MNNTNKALISSIVLMFALTGCSQQQVDGGGASQVAGSSQQVAGSSQQQVSPEQVSKECPECNAPKVEPVATKPAPVMKPKPPVVAANPWTHGHPANKCTKSIRHTHKFKNSRHSHTYACGKKPARTIDVSALQRKLKAKGYYKGPIDGVINPGTRSALKRYQQNRR